jgi:hypothetical protein
MVFLTGDDAWQVIIRGSNFHVFDPPPPDDQGIHLSIWEISESKPIKRLEFY